MPLRLKRAISPDDSDSEQQHLEKLYQEAQQRPYSKIYKPGTQKGIDRIENVWTEFCTKTKLGDSRKVLLQSDVARYMIFLEWLKMNYLVPHVESVITYWRSLSQLYTVWNGGRGLDKIVLKQIIEFIGGHLKQKYNLSDTPPDQPLLDGNDLGQLLYCHWVTDPAKYPDERQRVQVATLILLAGFTGSRPTALLSITYEDLDLFVARSGTEGEGMLVLRVKLSKVKNSKRPKKYTFLTDDSPFYCIVLHMVCLACNDRAFVCEDMTPSEILGMMILPGLRSQQIPWREGVKKEPVFRRPLPGGSRRALPYDTFNAWLKRLGESAGFGDKVTTYCFRRAAGNAINDDPSSTGPVRNLVLDHESDRPFCKNYLSRLIRFDTKAAYLGRPSRVNDILVANSMSSTLDPRRPTRLTIEQVQAVSRDPLVLKLCNERDRLRKLATGPGSLAHDKYLTIKKRFDSLKASKHRAYKLQLRKEYDACAPTCSVGNG